MIRIYTGTPGSGKSLHVAKDIIKVLKDGYTVFANFPVNENMIQDFKGNFTYIDTYEMNPEYFIQYAKKNHKKGREGQTLIVIDEAQRIFDSRAYQNKDRKPWNTFLQLHRHYGYNITLVTQADRLIDRQMRSLIEYESHHRKITNYGMGGQLIGLFIGQATFICIEKWYGVNEKINSYYFRGNKKLYSFYDSYTDFDEEDTEEKTEQKTENNIQEEEIFNDDDFEYLNLKLYSYSRGNPCRV